MLKAFDRHWYFIFTVKALMRQSWATMEYLPTIDFVGRCEEYGFTLKQGQHIYDLCFLAIAREKPDCDPFTIREIMNDHVLVRLNAQ